MSQADIVRKVILGGFGAIPVAGSVVSSLVDVLWKPAYEKRVEAFLHLLVEELNKIDQRVEDIDQLLNRDVVISVGLEAAAAAGMSHDEQKRQYLANAITRVTIDPSWDARADLALIMIRLVRELTTTHILILDFLANPLAWQEARSQRLEIKQREDGRFYFHDLISQAFSNIALDSVSIQAVLSDLETRGLLAATDVSDPQSGTPACDVLMQPLTNDLGNSLLSFISEVKFTKKDTECVD